MASSKIISDPNALLLYRVGPVLCCSPTTSIEAVVIPPSIVRPPGTNKLNPGVFKNVSGLVMLVDLRVAFGIKGDASTKEGRIIIVRLEDGHPGFWVDEIIDVIEMPKTGWSQVPALIPRDIFERTLLLDEKIGLYCNFDRLSQCKEIGYLSNYIEKLELVDNKDNSAVVSDAVVIDENDPKEQISDRWADVDSSNKNTDAAITQIEEKEHEFKKQEPVSGSKLEPLGRADQKLKQIIDHEAEAKPKFINDIDNSMVSKAKFGKNEYRSSDRNIGGDYEKQYRNANEDSRLYDANRRQSLYQDEDDGLGRLLGTAIVTTILLMVAVYYLLDSGEYKSTEDLFVQESIPDKLESDAYADMERKGRREEIDRVDEQPEEPGLSTIVKAGPGDVNPDNIKEISNGTEILRSGLVDIEKDEQGYVIRINQSDIEDRSEQSLHALESDRNLALDDVKESVQDEMNQDQMTYDEQADKSESGTVTGLVIEPEVGKINEQEIVVVEPVRSNEAKTVEITREIIHIVVKGDTLWHIAKQYVNNPFRYPELARLSNIKNPDLIYPGDRVKILIIRYH